MSYRVLIRRNSDGAEQWSSWYPWYDNDASNPGSILFSWLENNFSCDCNRYLEFERGAGTPEDEMTDDECGDTAYEVLQFEADDGRVVDRESCAWVTRPVVPTPSR